MNRMWAILAMIIVVSSAFVGSSLGQVSSPYSAAVIADKPLAFWQLGESSGNTATDATGHGHDGTYQGGVTLGNLGPFLSGGAAAQFDGTSGYVSLPGIWGGSSAAVTVEAWVKAAATTGTWQAIVEPSDISFVHFQLFCCGNDVIYTNAGEADLPILPESEGTWQYVAITGHPGAQAEYLNGTLLGSNTLQYSNILPTAAGDLHIGRGYTGFGGARFFNGQIANVAIYDYALSPQQIAAHLATGNGAALALSPASATDMVGQSHTVTALASNHNTPYQGATVYFTVTGANPTSGNCVTGADGTCPFTYMGVNAGMDTINAETVISDINVNATPVTETWVMTAITLTFPPSQTPETEIATSGQPTDPAAQSLAITVGQVINALNVTVTFHYEQTELSTGHTGVGIADGICERSQGATEATDFDCRFSDGGFVYQTLPNGDQVVPHIIPSHNNEGVWESANATRVSDGQPAVSGVDYNGPVDWYHAWNTNPSLANPSTNGEYAPGWNNGNPQLFDRPGENANIAFIFNITDYSKFNCNPTCVGTADPGVGGHRPTFNDVVAADPPFPQTGSTDTARFVIPTPSDSPFRYEADDEGILVVVRVNNATTGAPDPNATTFPHSMSIAVLDSNGNRQPVDFPKGFPTTFTYKPYKKDYSIRLSAKPYTPGAIYNLQVNSDVFVAPLSQTFTISKDE